MDESTLEAWIEEYIEAWASNEPGDIGRLFAEDALYYTAPFREPWRGREGIIAGWLARRDEPGEYDFRYEIMAVAGNVGFIRGWTRYFDPPPRQYSNLWVVQLDGAGRCTEFTEWWMLNG